MSESAAAAEAGAPSAATAASAERTPAQDPVTHEHKGVSGSAPLPYVGLVIDISDWKVIEDRPGYFGAKREARHREYDAAYGAGNWMLGWKLRDGFVTREVMTMLYEDSYYEYLRRNPLLLARLVTEASEVYDDAASNVSSGFDYTIQETDRTHVQDIAIRRVVARLGERFRGPELIQIRDDLGEHELSKILSPGHVPFLRPTWIEQPEVAGWWDSLSVESFYQSNKHLLVRARSEEDSFVEAVAGDSGGTGRAS